MSLSEKRCSRKRVSSRNQIPLGFIGTSAVLAVAIMGWCAAIQGAEIHEAAELGDLEKVRVSLYNTVCPKCGCSITPDKIRRIDLQRIRCPECGGRFVPTGGKSS